jgi:hypothetical protein
MIEVKSRFYSTTITVVFIVLLIGNALFLRNYVLGAALLVTFLGIFGNWVGMAAAPNESGAIRSWLGAWMLLSGIMAIGALAYYLAAFTAPVALALAALSGPVAWLLASRSRTGFFERPHDLVVGNRHAVPRAVWFAAAIVIVGLLATALLVASGMTTEAVRSPWLNIPPAAFLAFGVATLALFALLWRGNERALTISLTMAALAIFLSVAILVFPLGFGFDPFIHQATEEHIAKFGTITPKPFYYIGQYALVLFAHHAFALPLPLVNTYLVPTLAVLFLPMAWYAAAAHLLREKRAAAATLSGLFLIPLSSFILSTPQGLANLWTLLLVLAAVPTLIRDEKPRVGHLLIPALAAALTHPIAGLPALLFVILLASDPARNQGRVLAKIVFWIGVATGSVLLPLSFVVNSLLSTGTLGLNLSFLSNLSNLSNLSLFLQNRFNPLLDFVYLYGYNVVAILVLFALVGWWVSRRPMHGTLRTPLLMTCMLAVNWLLLSTAVDFSFLIDYERQNFADRLVPLSIFFLVPFMILALGTLWSRLNRAPVSLRLTAIVLLAALATASWYLTYPRHDAYETGRGFNVSRADIDAVHEIETDAAGAPYVVLANQSVSAAAVRELGFVRYYGELFFYPIPTGGDLYANFLDMNERPSRETAAAALELVNARCAAHPACTQAETSLVYYVVNAYWWEAPRLVETAKQNADAWWALDKAAVHVFKYQISN